jgi:hypothetical protein
LAALLVLTGRGFAESGILQYVLAGNTYTYVDTPTVGSGRYMPFSPSWTRDGVSPSTNYYFNLSGGQWYASGLMGFQEMDHVPPGGDTSCYLLRSIVGAYIQSPPLVGGVGTIYFTSRTRKIGHPTVIQVQISTNDTSGAGDWETVQILNYPKRTTRVDIAQPICINHADARRVRFILTEASPYDKTLTRADGAVCFDNIAISKPWERITNTGLWGPDFAYPE